MAPDDERPTEETAKECGDSDGHGGSETEAEGGSSKTEHSAVKKTYSRDFLLSLSTLEVCQKQPENLDPNILREISEAGIPIPQAVGRGPRKDWDSDSTHSKSPQDAPEWRKDSWRNSNNAAAGQPPLIGHRRRGPEEEMAPNALSSSYPPRPSSWDGNGQRNVSQERQGSGYGAVQNYGPQGQHMRRDGRQNERPIRGYRGPGEDNAGPGIPDGVLSLRPGWGHGEINDNTSGGVRDRGRDTGAGLMSPPRTADRSIPPSKYQPPRGKEDHWDSETFGDGEMSSSSRRQMELERKRREEFEAMRRAQLKRNSEQREGDENSMQTRKHDIESLWDPDSFSSDSPPSAVPLTQGARPIVPPGFAVQGRGAPPQPPPGFKRPAIEAQVLEASGKKESDVTKEMVLSREGETTVSTKSSLPAEVTAEEEGKVQETVKPANTQNNLEKERAAESSLPGVDRKSLFTSKGPAVFLNEIPDEAAMALPPFMDSLPEGEEESGSLLDRLFRRQALPNFNDKSQLELSSIDESSGVQAVRGETELKTSKFARWFPSADGPTTEPTMNSSISREAPPFHVGNFVPAAVSDNNNSTHNLAKSLPPLQTPPPPNQPLIGGIGALFALASSKTSGPALPSSREGGPIVFRSLEDIESSILAEAESAPSAANNDTFAEKPMEIPQRSAGPGQGLTEGAWESASQHLLSLLHKGGPETNRTFGGNLGTFIIGSTSLQPTSSLFTAAAGGEASKRSEGGLQRREEEGVESDNKSSWDRPPGIGMIFPEEGSQKMEDHMQNGPEKRNVSPPSEAFVNGAFNMNPEGGSGEWSAADTTADSAKLGTLETSMKSLSMTSKPSNGRENASLEGVEAASMSRPKQMEEEGEEGERILPFFNAAQPSPAIRGWPSFLAGVPTGPPLKSSQQAAEYMAASRHPESQGVEAFFHARHGEHVATTSTLPTVPFQGPSPLDMLRQGTLGLSLDRHPPLAHQYHQLPQFHRNAPEESLLPPLNRALQQQQQQQQHSQGHLPFPLLSHHLPPHLAGPAFPNPLHPSHATHFMGAHTPQGMMQGLPPSSSFHASMPLHHFGPDIPIHPFASQAQIPGSSQVQGLAPSFSAEKASDAGFHQWLVSEAGWGREPSKGLSQRVAASQMMGVEELERQLRFR